MPFGWEIEMSLIKTGVSWFKQSFTWSNTWISWQERLIAAAFMFGAVVLFYLTITRLDLWQALLAWFVYTVVLTIGSMQGWLKLLGPVLFYDMIRTARLSRYSIIRMLYAGFLLLI